ncbi:MAG: hypothetical protein R3E10_07610 [Gemmatimonadota bacterium]
MSMRVGLGLSALVMLAFVPPLAAQRPEQLFPPAEPRGEAGGHLVVAMPVGEFGDYVDIGGGFAGFGVLYLDPARVVGLRLDGAWLIYGSRTVRRPLSPTVPFVDVDVTTQNWIARLGFGPEVALGSGPVRPYLHGSIGFSYFATTTSVEGSLNTEPFASSTNFDDITFALAGGGGLRIRLSGARAHRVSLDVGSEYVRNGRTEYLREGGLRETPGGGVQAEPIRSRTNLVTFYLGVSVGAP